MNKILYILFFISLPFYGFSETVYVTRTGHRYHKDDCYFLKNSKISKELSAAENAGYKACSICFGASGASTTTTTESSKYLRYGAPIGGSVMLVGGLAYAYYRRRKWNFCRKTNFSETLTIYELSFLTTVLNDNEPIDTNRLNSLLNLDDKTLDSQRKSRAKFLKVLNEKISDQFGVEDGVQRVASNEDRRIVYYSLDTDIIEEVRAILTN
ncbi:MAG: hypothetical protein K9I84_03625 [Leadbetterella sp.]|nr:hypothetical protein [Leadbetterella sp.]